MQIIIISPNNTSHRHWHISRRRLNIIAVSFLLVLSAILFFINQQFGRQLDNQSPAIILATQSITSPSEERQPERHLEDYYAKRLGQLQAESIRLTALTEKLAEIAGIDTSDFYQNPVDPLARSLMNVPFTLHDATLDATFLQEAAAALRCHRP